jgi:hypothetical protein
MSRLHLQKIAARNADLVLLLHATAKMPPFAGLVIFGMNFCPEVANMPAKCLLHAT